MQISEERGAGRPAGAQAAADARDDRARALELFERQGFEETTIPQIAEAADVSPRTFSAYFPHKEDLAFPDSDEAFERLRGPAARAPPGETAFDALRAWIERLARDGGPRGAPARRRVIDADERCAPTSSATSCGPRAARRGDRARPRRPRRRPRAADGGRRDLTLFELLGEHSSPATWPMPAVDRALLFIGGGIGALR